MVLSMNAQLLAEIAELEGRTQRVVLDEQQVVFEEDLIIPDELVIECFPIEPEQNDDEE